VKLVEYASYSCPHCAEFAARGADPLQNTYVKSGRVSWEYRPFLLFAADAAIATLVRCKGAGASFLITEQIYAQQPQWESRLQALSSDQQQQLNQMNPQQKMKFLIQTTGLDEFFRQRGMTNTQIDSCLADGKMVQRAVDITDDASNNKGVTGTPTFFINGQNVPETATWEKLEPSLKQALGE